jgi:hypothetical protein
VEAVVAGLWEVDDKALIHFTSVVHSLLIKGQSPGDGLAEAQRTLLARSIIQGPLSSSTASLGSFGGDRRPLTPNQ